MSDSLLINDKSFLKIKSAARQFGYSSDYVTRLARTKKISAVQSGRRWFVDTESLAHYIESQKVEQEVRQQQLRKMRQQELAHHQRVAEVAPVATQRASRQTVAVAVVAVAAVSLAWTLGFVLNDRLAVAGQAASLLPSTGGALQEAVLADEDQVLSPVYTVEAETVVVDNTRSVARPNTGSDWLTISYE